MFVSERGNRPDGKGKWMECRQFHTVIAQGGQHSHAAVKLVEVVNRLIKEKTEFHTMIQRPDLLKCSTVTL